MNCKHCNAPLRYLSKAQAAQLACIDRKTLYRWIAKGKIKEHDVEGSAIKKIDREELEEILNTI